MIRSYRWLPHPIMSAVLLVVWLLLNNTLAPGHVVLGAALAVLIPVLTSGFWPERPVIHRPLTLLRLLPTVLYDIVVANVVVARLILDPQRTPRSRFLTVPLDLTDEFAITVLAGIITLTPGTVSADLALDRSHLLVHGLDVGDEGAVVAQIKRRYEAPLKEIFEC
jgi:multicomponent K+:H+ antiporter subunit E